MGEFSIPFQPRPGTSVQGSKAVIKANWEDAFEPDQIDKFKVDLSDCDLQFSCFTASDCPYDIATAPGENYGIFAMAAFTCIVMATAAMLGRARGQTGNVADPEAALKAGLGKLWKLRFEPLVRK
jgi:hypothetical protein